MARIVAVLVGGFLGTFARFALDALIPHTTPGAWAISTTLVNVTGSFVLGFLTASLWVRRSTPPWLKAGLGPGLLGSFTTFSAIVLNVVAAAHEGRVADALLALLSSLLLGLAAAWLGLRLGARASRNTRSYPRPDVEEFL